ncbi:hypothetical protein CDL15_Pgr005133 [Punica granatum]|uniref:phenylalanine--tRNA ligase n=3 Tax=Punica granatum TaxID=22663 RepID=A0A218WNZ5_PUNGR|nr:hypothetical protein CDL15_Pgr005133 [Punica granatum]
MPTVSVGRDRLFAALRRTYTREEFEDLCFSFGIELDDVTSEKEIIKKERHLEEEEEAEEPVASKEVIYKIEVPANRYDLLCLEGIAQALQIFNRQEEVPNYTVAAIPKESMLRMHVRAETSQIRPYIVCAVLRGITFDEASYNSFIDLQDKLHQNICRRRTLVAVGTHDLDTLEGPFTYEALPPPSINFVPLKQVKNFRADELMEFYKSDLKLKKFLHIIENSPVFPVLYDSRRTVLSLPPVINGAHSAITLKTKNVFIECTATDLRKANIVLNTLVTAFSTYCERKFEVEPVEVIYADGKSYICPDLSIYRMDVPVSYITDSIGVSLEAEEVTAFSTYCERKFEVEPVEVIYADGKSYICPDLSIYRMDVPVSYITDSIGVSLEAEEVTSLLQRMQLSAEESVSPDGKSKITVSIPPTRSDVLHPCDVMEDVAIAYGYNNIPKRKPASLKPLPLNQLSDLIRLEIATNGFTEVLTWILCSYKENFDMLNRKDDKSTAVIIGNPRSADFEIFEVGDVTLLDDSKDVGATNRRQLAALYCGTNSGFELIHGLVDRIMEVIGTPFVTVGDDSGYYIQLSDEPEFLPGRQASIIYKGKHFGNFGIVHPEADAAKMSIVNSTMQDEKTKFLVSAAEEHTRSATPPTQNLTEDVSSHSSQLPPRVEELDRQEGDYIEDEALPHEEANQNLDQEPIRNNLLDSTHTDIEVGMNKKEKLMEDSFPLSSASSHSKEVLHKEKAEDNESNESSVKFKRRNDFGYLKHAA